jgi:hypothetical protein
MILLISYDLKKVKNYPYLYTCLNQWKAQRLLESLWVANVAGPPETVRDILKAYIDGDDAIVVVELRAGTDWATLRAKPGGVALLKLLGPVHASA